jgi:hypothetical protein
MDWRGFSRPGRVLRGISQVISRRSVSRLCGVREIEENGGLFDAHLDAFADQLGRARHQHCDDDLGRFAGRRAAKDSVGCYFFRFHLNTSALSLINFPALILRGSVTKCTKNPIRRRVWGWNAVAGSFRPGRADHMRSGGGSGRVEDWKDGRVESHPHAIYRRVTSHLLGMSVRFTSVLHAWYMRGTCDPKAWAKRGTGQKQARSLGGTPEGIRWVSGGYPEGIRWGSREPSGRSRRHHGVSVEPQPRKSSAGLAARQMKSRFPFWPGARLMRAAKAGGTIAHLRALGNFANRHAGTRTEHLGSATMRSPVRRVGLAVPCEPSTTQESPQSGRFRAFTARTE